MKLVHNSYQINVVFSLVMLFIAYYLNFVGFAMKNGNEKLDKILKFED